MNQQNAILISSKTALYARTADSSIAANFQWGGAFLRTKQFGQVASSVIAFLTLQIKKRYFCISFSVFCRDAVVHENINFCDMNQVKKFYMRVSD